MIEDYKYNQVRALVERGLTRSLAFEEYSVNNIGKHARTDFDKHYTAALNERKKKSGQLTREQTLQLLAGIAMDSERDADRISAAKTIIEMEGWKSTDTEEGEDDNLIQVEITEI